jgi:outer membrane lipoprotein SlyB
VFIMYSTFRRTCVVLFFFTMAAQADTLVLRTGKVLHGTLVGANARQIDFLTDAGKTEQIAITSIDRISFSAPSAPKPAATSKPAPAPAPAKPSVTIPAGTTIRVRTIDPIDVDTTQAGAKFRGSIDDPIMIGGSVVIPRGADLTLQVSKVQQSGKMKGSDLIELKVNRIVVNGSPYPVVTTFQQVKGGSEGKSSTKKVVGGAGLGAIIGGIAGGGKGAAIGAAVGTVGGAAVSASGQQHLKVPAETRMEFRLESDLKI